MNTNIADVRIYLRQNFYTNGENINKLIEILYMALPILNINFDPNNLSLTIKIRKGEIKKAYPNFIHNSLFYYNILNKALMTLFKSTGIIDSIVESNSQLQNFFSNINNIQLLYNLITESDNIIMINF